MDSSSILSYLQALDRLQQSTWNLRPLIEGIKKCCEWATECQRQLADGNVGHLSSYLTSQTPPFQDNWPSGEDLAKAVKEWQDAHAAVTQAWQQLGHDPPPVGLQPPAQVQIPAPSTPGRPA